MRTITKNIRGLNQLLMVLRSEPSKTEGYLYGGDPKDGRGGLCLIQAERYFMLRDLLHHLLLEGELVDLAKRADWEHVRCLGESPKYKNLLREFLESLECADFAPELLLPVEWPTSNQADSSGE